MTYGSHRNCGHRNHGGNDAGMGCLLWLILGLVAMPLVGLYLLLSGKDFDKKAIGLVLLVLGTLFWIMVAG